MYRALLFVLILFYVILPAQAQQGDGIPGNCENSPIPEERVIFPRYEPQNRRLVLVNWNTGEDVRVLAADLNTTQILGWSVDCRYLAGAVQLNDTFATTVWDAATSTQIGAVPDALNRPHVVTWGPSGYLVVETRAGAILWNVPANTQTKLTDSYNTTTGRNFSRLRWDAEHLQLIANLAVGGRAVYDLTTGLELPLAARQTNSRPVPNEAPTVLLGGRTYPCEGDFRHGYRYWFSSSGVRDVYLRYDFTNQTVFLELNDIYGPEETLVMLENRIEAAWLQTRTWSSSCRYVTASLGIPEEDVSDTFVWDVVEAKQLGIIPDAKKIMHPISDSGYDDVMLVETRNGAILWNLATNTQYSVSTTVNIPVSGRSTVRNFVTYTWGPGYFYAVPFDNPRAIDVYSINTGEITSRYTVDFDIEALNYNDAQLLEARNYSGRWQSALLDPASGAVVETPSTPTYRTSSEQLNTVSPAAAVNGISGYGTQAGGASYLDPMWSEYRNRFDSYSVCNNQIVSYDEASRSVQLTDAQGNIQSVIEAGVNFTSRFGWSPNCTYISAQQAWTSNADVSYDDQQLDDIYRDDLSYDVVIWNAGMGTRVATLARPYRFESPSTVEWSPQADRALVRTTEGYFILNPATGESVLLTYTQAPGYYSSINTYFETYWDFERGQLITSGWSGALVFDLRTGIQRALLDGRQCWFGGCTFNVSPNHEYLTVGLAAYNLDTLTGRTVDFDISNDPLRISRIALSPDGRYLVLRRISYYVWDMTALPEKHEDRDPIFTFNGRIPGSDSRFRSMRFIGNVTLEIKSRDGSISYWNVETGQQVE